jgi:hypothetical protein
MKKNVITIPESWDDINLGQYLEFLQTDFKELGEIQKMTRVISILTDIDEETIQNYNLDEINYIINQLSWCYLKSDGLLNNIVTIDNVKYGVIKNLSSIKVGEWIDIEGSMDNFKGNLHKILSVIYRPVTKYRSDDDYEIEDYDANTAKIRSELFLLKFKTSDAMSASLFFWSFVEKYLENMVEYLEQERIAIAMEMISLD